MPEKIKILREYGGLGDVVSTFSIYNYCRRMWPQLDIEYHVLGQYKSLVEMLPRVEVVGYSKKTRREKGSTPSVSSPYFDCTTAGHRHERDRKLVPSYARSEAFLLDSGLSLPANCSFSVPAKYQIRKDFPRPLVIVHSRAASESRRWRGWSRVCRELEATTVAVDAVVKPRIGATHTLVGLQYPTLAALLSSADLVLAIDSGILHLSGALGVPTIGIFGSTYSEVTTRPYPSVEGIMPEKKVYGEVCKKGIPCYGTEKCGESCPVIDSISSERVVEMAKDYLSL